MALRNPLSSRELNKIEENLPIKDRVRIILEDKTFSGCEKIKLEACEAIKAIGTFDEWVDTDSASRFVNMQCSAYLAYLCGNRSAPSWDQVQRLNFAKNHPEVAKQVYHAIHEMVDKVMHELSAPEKAASHAARAKKASGHGRS